MAAAVKLRLGTRGSPLARWQAEWVAGQLQALGCQVDLVPIATQGDVQQTDSIGGLGAQGVFTKEIQRALLEGTVDLAVHSLKDLPTEPVDGLCLACVPLREDVNDVLISRAGTSLDELPAGATIGTGSLRRQAQLLHHRPDLKTLPIRGNVDTRLRKLDAGEYDAIVLARAGMKRLGLADRITQVLPLTLMLPAVGQGALGLETRLEDEQTYTLLAPLNDRPTHMAVLAERGLLHHLRGGCLAPVGAWARMDEDLLRLSAVVLSADGQKRIDAESTGDPAAAAALGIHVADKLLSQEAAAIIAASRIS